MEFQPINPQFSLNPEFSESPSSTVETVPVALAPTLRNETDLPQAQDVELKFDEGITQFRIQIEAQGLAENSIKAIFHDLSILVTYFQEDTLLSQIDQEDLESFLHWLEFERGVPCNKKTLARRLTSLKTFFRWLTQQAIIPHDPAADIQAVKVDRYLPVILDRNEVRQLMASASSIFWDYRKPDARPLLLLSLLLQTGIKKHECIRLQYANFNFASRNQCTLTIPYPSDAPAHKSRRVPIAYALQSYLTQYRQQYAPDAHDQSPVFTCTSRNLEYVLEELGQAADIQRCNVGFEILRWTCIVNDFRTGMPETALMQKLGLSKTAWRDTLVRLRTLG